MSFERRPLLAGNWKMNGLRAALAEIERAAEGYDAALREKLDLLICPPATLLAAAAAIAAPARISVGGQDCHSQASGAHTGDISAPMLADAGAAFVIVGHSERRADHGESDALVRAKALAALEAGLTPIVCVGETRAQREAGEAEAIVASQIAGSIPAGVAARASRAGLRAHLGHRHGADADAARRGENARLRAGKARRLARRRQGRGARESSTEARSSRRTPRSCSASPTSMARWSAAPACSPAIFSE